MKFLHDNFNPLEVHDQPVVLCSHYDLDGVGSTYYAKLMFNVVKHYASGYPKVINNVKKAIGQANIIVFVDLDVPEEAVKLALKNFDIVYYCDHHPGSVRYIPIQEKIPHKFKYLFDHDYAATKILATKAASIGIEMSKAEIRFANACDAYDMWRVESKWFMKGYHLNTLFWEKSFWNFEPHLADMCEYDDFRFCFPDKDWIFAIQEHKRIIEFVQNEDNYNIVEADNFKAAFFLFPKGCFYVNDVLLFNKDLNAVVGIETGKNTGSIRINIEGQDLNLVLAKVKEMNSNVIAGSGHAFAAGFTLENFKGDDYADLVYDVIETLDEMMEDQ